MATYSQLFKREQYDEFDYKTTQDKTSGALFPAVCFVLLKANSQKRILSGF